MTENRHWDPATSHVEPRPLQLVMSRGEPGLMAAPHWHAQVELNLVRQGAMTYRMRDHEVTVQGGELALFWGGLPHRVTEVAPGTFYTVVHLPLAEFFRLRIDASTRRRLMGGAVLVSMGADPAEDATFARWEGYLGSGDPRRERLATDEIRLRIERLDLEPHRFSGVAPGAPGVTDGGAARGVRVVNRMCDYIGAHFREPVDASDIAAAAGVHVKHGMRAFRQSTALTLNDYLTLMRLSWAQARLVSSRAPIASIALDSGFGSISAFNKAFRKTAGMTPSAFRKAHATVT